jgi:hypothetical protein
VGIKALTNMKIYLAGPMRGIKDFNFPAFHEAAAKLRAQGHEVFNPAQYDEMLHGLGFNKSEAGDLKDISDKGFDLRKTLKADLCWITDNADAVAMLPNWEMSKGACAERAVALAIGAEVIYL